MNCLRLATAASFFLDSPRCWIYLCRTDRLFQHFSPLSSLAPSISPNTALSKHALRLHPSNLKQTNKRTRNQGLQPLQLYIHWIYWGAKHRKHCASHTDIEPFLKIISGMEEKILAYVLVFEHSGEQGLFLAETCHGLARQECTGMELLAENFTWLPKQHRWERACPTCSLAAWNINWFRSNYLSGRVSSNRHQKDRFKEPHQE